MADVRTPDPAGVWNVSCRADGSVEADPDWTDPQSHAAAVGVWVSWSARAIRRSRAATIAMCAAGVPVIAGAWAGPVGGDPWFGALLGAAVFAPLAALTLAVSASTIAGRAGEASIAIMGKGLTPESAVAFVESAGQLAGLPLERTSGRAPNVKWRNGESLRVKSKMVPSGALLAVKVRSKGGPSAVEAHTRFKGAVLEELEARNWPLRRARVAEAGKPSAAEPREGGPPF